MKPNVCDFTKLAAGETCRYGHELHNRLVLLEKPVPIYGFAKYAPNAYRRN